MTDIVERLLDTKSIYPIDLLRREAAAEIERLRVEIKRLEELGWPQGIR